MSTHHQNLYTLVSQSVGAPTKNVICSPFNIASCFSMLSDGSTGPCREQLTSFFGFAAPTEQISLTGNALKTFQDAMKGAILSNNRSASTTGGDIKKKDNLVITNSNVNNKKNTIAEMIKTAQGVFTTRRIKETYTAQMEKNYHALVKQINPADAVATVKLINDFVSKATEGKITNLLSSGDIDASTVLVLVAALYFKGKWSEPFKKENTKDADFHLLDGSTKKVPTMHHDKKKGVHVVVTGDVQTSAIPYEGHELVFVAEVYDNANTKYELPPSNLDNIMKAAMYSRSSEANVYMPKFKIESKAELSSVLKKDLGAIFSGSTNWAPMSDDPLAVSAVIHQAIVEVEESGTVAAAATAIPMLKCCARIPQAAVIPTVKLDRPFHFHIVDRKNGSVLFSGSVSDPKC